MQRLARDWDFDSGAGSSAGAIAAAVGAACEYKRRQGGDQKAFDALNAVVDDIKKDLFVAHLFQPIPDVRPGFELALKLVTSRRGKISSRR